METRIDFTSGLWERKMSDEHLAFPSFEIADCSDPFRILLQLLIG
jgi:hypothetical protein